MTDITDLQAAYEAIYLAESRGAIDREERNRRVIALRDTLAAGMTFAEREVIATKAVYRVMELIDEVYFSPSGGKWQ